MLNTSSAPTFSCWGGGVGGAGGREGRRYLYSRPRNRRGVEQHLGSVLTKGGPCTRSGVLLAATAQFRAVVALRGGLAGGGARRGHTSRVAPRVRRREAAGNGAQRQGLGPAQARHHVRPTAPPKPPLSCGSAARRKGATGWRARPRSPRPAARGGRSASSSRRGAAPRCRCSGPCTRRRCPAGSDSSVRSGRGAARWSGRRRRAAGTHLTLRAGAEVGRLLERGAGRPQPANVTAAAGSWTARK